MVVGPLACRKPLYHYPERGNEDTSSNMEHSFNIPHGVHNTSAETRSIHHGYYIVVKEIEFNR